MKLRTMFIALALAMPGGVAAAEEMNASPLGLEVRGDDGTLMSRIESVERDAQGRIIAVEAPGLAPDDAPAAANDLVAENDARHFFTSYSSAERNDRERSASGVGNRAR